MYRWKVSLKATNLVMADRECINKGGVVLFDWFVLRKILEPDLLWILKDIQYIAMLVMWITSREFCRLFNQTMIASFLLLKGFRTLPFLVCSARMYNLDALSQRDKKWVNILDVIKVHSHWAMCLPMCSADVLTLPMQSTDDSYACCWLVYSKLFWLVVVMFTNSSTCMAWGMAISTHAHNAFPLMASWFE